MSHFEFKFVPDSKDIEIVAPAPKPAKAYYPEWLKEMPSTWVNADGKQGKGTAKKCMPFTDTFVTGYVQELACDIEFFYLGKDQDGNDLINYKWAGMIRPLMSRGEQESSPNLLPKFPGYYKADLQWLSLWEPHTPPGYSTLYSHPFNRPDLPFYTFNGVIDTDKWPLSGPIPFLLKEGFQGVIPAGTPIYQVVFIKRDSWQSSTGVYDEKLEKSLTQQVKKHFLGGYKKTFWTKKEYN